MSPSSVPAVDPIPEEYGSLVVQLVVSPAERAIDFYVETFGAHEFYRQLDATGRKVVHCELLLGRSRLMLHDEFPERGLLAPADLGGSPVTLMHYVADVDAVLSRARAAGAEIASEPENKFWGVRSGVLVDPFGHRWLIASRIEDLSPADILERAHAQPGIARVPQGRLPKPT